MKNWRVRLRWSCTLFFYKLLGRLGLHREILFVGSHEALPPPLSVEEEAYLIKKLAQGDYAVKRILIERNLRLVVYIARKFENTGIGLEDLASIGTIGLIKAVNTFDPGKKIKLATYASSVSRMKFSCICAAATNSGRSILRRAPQCRLGRQRAPALRCPGHRARCHLQRPGAPGQQKIVAVRPGKTVCPGAQNYGTALRFG